MTEKSLSKPSPLRKWTLEALTIEAAKYPTRVAFSKGHQGAYRAAIVHGHLDQVCQHMQALKNYWTTESIAEVARGHTSRASFQELSSPAYQAALARGIVDQVCQHMEHKYIYWTPTLLTGEAKKFESRVEFYRKSSSAYNAARQKNLLDQICQHMAPLARLSDSVYFWEAPSLGIHKFGMSTAEAGNRRIIQVARRLNIVPRLIARVKVQSPRKVERQLLSLGSPVAFDTSFNGSTEFRRLTASEILSALRILHQSAI